jgi:hypothetical protein
MKFINDAQRRAVFARMYAGRNLSYYIDDPGVSLSSYIDDTSAVSNVEPVKDITTSSDALLEYAKTIEPTKKPIGSITIDDSYGVSPVNIVIGANAKKLKKLDEIFDTI